MLKKSQNYRTIFYAYLATGLACFVPFLLSPASRDLPVPVLVTVLVLGIVYFALTAFVYEWFVKNEWTVLLFVYFGVQLPLVVIIVWLSKGVGGTFWLLLLPLVGQSVNLPRWAMIFVAGGVPLLYGYISLVLGMEWELVRRTIISLVAAVVFVLAFTCVTNREWEARLEAERLAGELAEANQQLRRYAVQAEDIATLQERNRIAREIHDSLGHYLSIINMQLNAAQAVWDSDPEQAIQTVSKARRLTQNGLQEVRRSIAALREADQRPGRATSLIDALNTLLDESRQTGLNVTCRVQGEPRPMLPNIEHCLYRTAQEGVTNARKYSGASKVEIILDYTDAQQVRLTVADDGVGAAEDALSGASFGLLGLRERVALLGGQFHLESAPQVGFILSIEIPEVERDSKQNSHSDSG